MPEPPQLLMIIDPESREALRRGEGAAAGPLFFTSRAALEGYAEAEGIADFEVYEIPFGVLERMKGKPHWVDGKRR